MSRSSKLACLSDSPSAMAAWIEGLKRLALLPLGGGVAPADLRRRCAIVVSHRPIGRIVWAAHITIDGAPFRGLLMVTHRGAGVVVEFDPNWRAAA